jgi:hypothetical protein
LKTCGSWGLRMVLKQQLKIIGKQTEYGMKNLIIGGLALLSACVSLIYFISTFDDTGAKDEVNPENENTYKLIRIFGIFSLFVIALYNFITLLIK